MNALLMFEGEKMPNNQETFPPTGAGSLRILLEAPKMVSVFF